MFDKENMLKNYEKKYNTILLSLRASMVVIGVAFKKSSSRLILEVSCNMHIAGEGESSLPIIIL
jgi:hypothetical protein